MSYERIQPTTNLANTFAMQMLAAQRVSRQQQEDKAKVMPVQRVSRDLSGRVVDEASFNPVYRELAARTRLQRNQNRFVISA
ncbi:MAG: hypothetical protein A3B68_02760 [Candidatus Melainabacteria bacterium RIFCSPHIGHO2_02_FULL_34_12]|nr:MAG: hypothetical protein A3B68_02760 [Candidatus Melainabacteria bacterium RIFCSPHIGHO2_02_FULL_34_12]